MSTRPYLEAFEPRLLYSADALSLAMALGAGVAASDGAWAQAATSQVSTGLLTLPGVEIVVIDAALTDAASLLNDLAAQQAAGRQLEVLTLHAGEDGIARITELLAQRNNIQALHVLGHGADGVVLLGGTQLSSASLLARAGEIAGWGRAFSSNADVLIYGCDVASGNAGRQLVEDLAALTGCDVAASTDITASTLRGGNWVLEARSGPVETASALSSAEQLDYTGSLLANATLEVTRFTDDNNPGSLRWAITQANASGSANTINLSAGTYLLSLSSGGGTANEARDLDIFSNVTIVGAGAGQTVIASQGAWRHFEVSGGELNLSGVTLRNGLQTGTDTDQSESRGGSIYVHSGASLVLSRSIIEDSTAQNGGAVYVQGTATLTDVELRRNAARSSGGALYSEGWTSLSRVTVANNTAAKDGGGLYQTGSNLLRLVNLTLSGNRAQETGGGLYADAAAALLNVSVVNNVTGGNNGPSSGGGIYVSSGAFAVGVANSLFSGNVDNFGNISHSNRQLASGGNNLIANQSGVLLAGSDRNVGNIPLASLANNGGVSRTHALLAASPAINAANSSLAPSTDQRGTARQGAADIGAFEYINAAPSLSNVSLTVAEGGVAAPILDAQDAENDNVTVHVDAVTGGYFAMANNLGASVQSFAGSDPAFGLIRFVHTGNAAPTFSLRASDALNAGVASLSTVYFTPANRAPVQSGSSVFLGSVLEDATTPFTITQAQLLAGATDADGDPLGALNLQLTSLSVSSGSLLAVGPNTNAAAGLGSGLKGEYFRSTNLTGPVALTRTEAIDFNWGTDAPAPTLPANGFSVRWTGFVVPASSGAFTFRTESDDGIRVWINAVLVIDHFSDHAPAVDLSGLVGLQAGTAYAVKVEYAENTGAATARLQWKTPGSNTFSAVPAARLFDTAPPAPTQWTYTPAANYNGPVNFAFEVNDGREGQITRSANLAVTPVNDAPTVVTNQLTLSEGGTAVPQIVAADPDNPAASTLRFTASNITHGFFALTSDLAASITQFNQQQINSGLVRFIHDGSGSAPSYRLRVSDGMLSSSLSLAQIGFTAVNDAPVFVVNSLNIANGGMAVPGIVVTDEESTAAQLTLSVSALSGGRFELNGAPGMGITVFTQAQVNAGSVLFIHDGAFAAPSYRLTVTDPGGLSVFKDVVVSFDNANPAPQFLINTLDLSEGDSFIVTNGSISAIDGNDNNTQLTIAVSELQGGFFAYDATPGTKIFGFRQSEIDTNKVRFVHDGSNNAPSYRLTVSDPAGSSVTSLAVVRFTAINDAPVLSVNALSITEGGSAVPVIDASDEESTPAQLTFTVSGLSGGRFEFIGSAGVAVTQFTQAQIDNNQVRFVDAGSGTPPAYTLTVSDGAASSVPSRVNLLGFGLVNDPPVFTQNSLKVSEGGSAVPVIALNDPDTKPEDLRIDVSNLRGGYFVFASKPANTSVLDSLGGMGALRDLLEVVDSFTWAQYLAGQISFVHDGSELTPGYTLTVTDGNASDVSTLSDVVFLPVNDLPTFLENSLVITEGGSAVPRIRVADEDNSAGQLTIFAVNISGGRFELLGNPGQAVTRFTQLQVDKGEVRFVDNGLGSAPRYSLTAADPALLGTTTEAAFPSSVCIVSFTPVNDAPVFTSNALTVTEGGVARPSINVTDEDNGPTQLTLTVSDLSGGHFEFTAAAGVTIASFTQADLNAGSVRFVHDGSSAAPRYTLTATDADGARSSATLSNLKFTPVNDSPVIVFNTLTVRQGGTAVPLIQVTDEDNSAAELRFSVTALVAGRFELISAPGVAITQFTQAQLDADAVRFVHDGSSNAPRYGLVLTDGDKVQSTDATVTFTRLPPAPGAVVTSNIAALPAPTITTITTTTSVATATSRPPAASIKSTSTSAADVLDSRDAAAQAAAAEAAETQAQVHAASQATSQAGGAPFSNAGARGSSPSNGRDSAARVAALASANNMGGAVESDGRWANASVAAGTVSLQNLLLGGDANALDWNSSSSSMLDGKLLDAVLGSSDSSVRNTALDKAFERIREELDQGAQADGQVVAGSLVLSTSFSVGYVLWLARGGVLLASMASSIPAWATVDPLPVLSRFKARQSEGDDDEGGEGGLGGPDGDGQADKADALERLFSKARKVFSSAESAAAAGPVAAAMPAAAPALGTTQSLITTYPLSATEAPGVTP